MVLAAKVSLKNAENAKNALSNLNLMDYSYKVLRKGKYIYFPVKEKIANFEIVNIKLKAAEKKPQNLRDILKKKLTKKELSFIPSSYDIIGDIAIIEIKKEAEKKEKLIAEAFLELHKNIKVVAKKSGMHSGEFRTRKLKILAGEKRKETVYKESNAKIKLDVEKVYFSERLGTERLRIAKKIKKNESVLVMFSGCGPYPIVFAKNSPAKEIYGIEKNPVAHKYAVENLKLNHVNNVHLINADVKEAKLDKKFDRIVMPLPKSAEDFIETALLNAKKGTIIHFYDFVPESDIPNKSIEKIKKHVKKFRILKVVKCGQYSPGKYRICVDFQLQ